MKRTDGSPGERKTLRNGSRPSYRWLVPVVFALMLAAGTAMAGGFPLLDQETVFCAYFALSGEEPDVQDVEDLCWHLGRPTFSSFKPSEMFSENDRRAVRRRLDERIMTFDGKGLFRWPVEGRLTRSSPGGNNGVFRPEPGGMTLPRATECIGAEMTGKDRTGLKRAMKTLPEPVGEPSGSERFRVHILLRPESAGRRIETRNIAQEDVSIPIRFVVFRPVAVEAGDGTPIPIPLMR